MFLVAPMHADSVSVLNISGMFLQQLRRGLCLDEQHFATNGNAGTKKAGTRTSPIGLRAALSNLHGDSSDCFYDRTRSFHWNIVATLNYNLFSSRRKVYQFAMQLQL